MDLERYSAPQRQAITTTEGPVLVLAGAGSGKTGVLTGRVAYLIKNMGVSPYAILAITFTNKAANEMKERIAAQIDFDVKNMSVSTFHSICAKMLRFHAEKLGYTSSFSIYDTDDALRMIKKISNENSYAIDMTPSAVLSLISRAKNAFVRMTPQQFFEELGGSEDLLKVYNAYNDRLHAENAMDFDDLLLNVLQLLETDAETREYYQNRYRYVMVDEFQDTNSVQYEITRIIAEKYGNIFVVGDDDQSIYSWRGADVRNILNFEKDYPGAVVIKLEQNYRSHQRILDVSNTIIAKSINRKDKLLWSAVKEGDKPYLRRFMNEYAEAEYVANELQNINRRGEDYSECAVLYRSHTQSRVLEEKLRQRGVPYTVIGGVGFYSRKEVKDILAYMTILVNPDANTALTRIINEPKRGIGNVSINKLISAADAAQLSVYETLMQAEDFLDAATVKKLNSFIECLKNIDAVKDDKNIVKTLENVYRVTGYYDMLLLDKDAEARMENIDELIKAARDYEASADEPSLSDFLSGIALFTDADTEEEGAKVTLMTLHAAKGLEFDNVFMVGMEETVFPSYRSVQEGNIEEERRLCYVGMTRAKKHLYLTHCQSRSVYAKTEMKDPSRFIEEIPDHMLDIEKEEDTLKKMTSSFPKAKPKVTAARPTLGAKPSFNQQKRDTASFDVGMTVSHKTFGIGQIKSITGAADNRIAVVDFSGTEKKMFLAFAPLEIID
ncbi:MAG: ATP-dependent DNA helicase PcrA [Clostridiales bacterium]|nr:ATP-dependent DNA helicase PcrA [Clostridiales bacterium]